MFISFRFLFRNLSSARRKNRREKSLTKIDSIMSGKREHPPDSSGPVSKRHREPFVKVFLTNFQYKPGRYVITRLRHLDFFMYYFTIFSQPLLELKLRDHFYDKFPWNFRDKVAWLKNIYTVRSCHTQLAKNRLLYLLFGPVFACPQGHGKKFLWQLPNFK